jgi:cobalt-zinc-cadmium efflux system membrane fusion protein
MKRIFNYLPLIVGGVCVSLFTFSSCTQQKKQASAHDHEHHDHDHDHSNQEGHNHSHEDEHDHDHDHSHEVELEEGQVHMSDKQFKQLGLGILKVERSAYRQIVKTSGRLLPAMGQEKVVVAKQSGILSFAGANLAPGKAVNNREILAYISDQQLVEGEQFAQLKLQHDAAKRELDRAEGLLKDALISQVAYNEAKLNYETLSVRLKTFSGAASARGLAHQANLSGFIKELHVLEGSYVNAGDVIATLTSTKQLRLQADLPEKYANMVSTIRSANFKMASGDQILSLDELNGKVVSYARALETSGHFLPVVFEFDNKGNLLAGGYVEVYLKGAETETITVPLDALVEMQGSYFVFVKEKAEVYRKQLVKVGTHDGRVAQILSGLKPGDEVVTQGAVHLKLASMTSAIPHSHAH